MMVPKQANTSRVDSAAEMSVNDLEQAAINTIKDDKHIYFVNVCVAARTNEAKSVRSASQRRPGTSECYCNSLKL